MQQLTDNQYWSLSFEGNFTGGMRYSLNPNDFGKLYNDQGLTPQNANAWFQNTVDYAELGFIFTDKLLGKVVLSGGYYIHDTPQNFGMDTKALKAHTFLFKKAYFEHTFISGHYYYWIGLRSFEFQKPEIFQTPNPLNQYSLVGAGIGTVNYNLALAMNKTEVQSLRAAPGGILVKDSNGHVLSDVRNEYSVRFLFSGKMDLRDGYQLQPLISVKYFVGNKKTVTYNDGTEAHKIKPSSALLFGLNYLRPFNGYSGGVTTFWFRTLPVDEDISSGISNDLTRGFARVRNENSESLVGVLDSSFFDLGKSGFLNLDHIFTYETYITTEKQKNLSLAYQYFYPLINYFYPGVGFELHRHNPQIFADDINSKAAFLLFTFPFFEKFDLKKSAFISIGYGKYSIKNKSPLYLTTGQIGVDFSI